MIYADPFWPIGESAELGGSVDESQRTSINSLAAGAKLQNYGVALETTCAVMNLLYIRYTLDLLRFGLFSREHQQALFGGSLATLPKQFSKWTT